MNKKICLWDEDDEAWKTDCGHAFIIDDGTPLENDMVFCCFCGKKLKEKRKTD